MLTKKRGIQEERSRRKQVMGPDFKWFLENDFGWVTGVMVLVLVDLDDKETEAPLSRNKFHLLAYVKHFP